MPAPVGGVAVDQLALGAGYLYYAPLATAAPTNTVTGSVFTDAWPAGWVAIGGTDSGSVFNYALSTDNVEVEEFLNPVKVVETGVVASIAFSMVQMTQINVKRAINGGTTTTTGATTTTLTTLTPPALGSAVRCMIGWESTDFTERLWIVQAFQVGAVAIPRRKGVNKAVIPVEFRAEQPTGTGTPWTYATAGAGRV